MSNGSMPFPEGKIQQFVVQLACRIPTKKDITAGDRRTLENTLRELDADYFQLPTSDTPKNTAWLFQVFHQFTIGASVITLPAFDYTRDSFSFYYPRRMTGQFFTGVTSIDTRPLNNRVSGWANRVQDAVPNSRCQRAGKIYLMVLGPFTPEEKEGIFTNLFSANLTEIGEVNLRLTYYRAVGGTVYNIQNTIGYMQQKVDSQYYINLRVDINNRDLRDSMEPPDVERVWNLADEIIVPHLQGLLSLN